eukprot:TRINITY_DN88792_c0_g1_i1.p1 TRINITY_DN88792_c0_g1~~TRINITY_DN88792_c0_g1_i1.p1  ORF type:complete len:538 (-),score=82.08 TRINITY_DN88792_c0_g1_i1:36-1649(-)
MRARLPTDFAILAVPAKKQEKPTLAPAGRVLKPAPWQPIREGTYTAGVSFQELISGQLLDADQAKQFFQNASNKFSREKRLVFDKDRNFDEVEKPLEGMLSLWQLCELVSSSDVRLGGLCSQEPAVQAGSPDPAVQAASKAGLDGVKAELEAWEADFMAGLHDLSLENVGSLDGEASQSALDASKERQSHQLDKPYISVNGCWQPGMDDGPGSADNPQVQLRAGRHMLLQVELRAVAPQAQDSLELWVLRGTCWGTRVKSLKKSFLITDDGDLRPRSPESKARQETKGRLLYGHVMSLPDGSNEVSSHWSFEVLTSASSVAQGPGPLRVRIECEVSAQDTVTLLLARGQPRLPAEEDRTSSKASILSVATFGVGARGLLAPAPAQPTRPIPSQATTPRSARVWGWQPNTSHQPDQGASPNNSFELRLWTSSPCSKGPTLLSWLPDIDKGPKVQKVGPTSADLLAEKAVRHEDLLARAEASLWAARANVALHARFCMNADIDEMRGNLAGPKALHLRQVSGVGVQRTKSPRGALKTAR